MGIEVILIPGYIIVATEGRTPDARLPARSRRNRCQRFALVKFIGESEGNGMRGALDYEYKVFRITTTPQYATYES